MTGNTKEGVPFTTRADLGKKPSSKLPYAGEVAVNSQVPRLIPVIVNGPDPSTVQTEEVLVVRVTACCDGTVTFTVVELPIPIFGISDGLNTGRFAVLPEEAISCGSQLLDASEVPTSFVAVTDATQVPTPTSVKV